MLSGYHEVAGNALDPGRSVVSKITAILTTFTTGNAHSMTEIARLADLPISTAHRLLTELTARGMIDRATDGTFRAGLILRTLPRGGSPSTTGIEERGPRVLEDLCNVTGTVARLGVLVDDSITYVEKQPGNRPVSSFAASARLPAHASALGKAILAFSPPSAVERVIKRGTRSYTARTLTSAEQFRRSLASTRSTSIALSNGELERGRVWIASPVFGQGGEVVAAIELRLHNPRKDMVIMAPILKIAARSLSRELVQTASGDRKGERTEPSP